MTLEEWLSHVAASSCSLDAFRVAARLREICIEADALTIKSEQLIKALDELKKELAG